MMRTNKACDACRTRKVRCNGATPCSQCAHLNLSCVFSPPTGRRRHGVRGSLVAQLRKRPYPSTSSAPTFPGIQGPSHLAIGTADAHCKPTPDTGRITGANIGHIRGHGGINHSLIRAHDEANLSAVESLLERSPIPRCSSDFLDSGCDERYGWGGSHDELVHTPDYFLPLITEFERVIYPQSPIITADEIRATIATMHSSHEDTALVYAFAAITITLTRPSWTLNMDVAASVTDCIRRSLSAHRKIDLDLTVSAEQLTLGELSITVKRIMTCLFLEMSMVSLRLFDRAFTILREAISMTQTLRIFQYGNDADGNKNPSSSTYRGHLRKSEIARRQRLYWECFIHERFLNIVSGGPAILPPLSTGLPLPDPTIPSYVDVGFRRLIVLFRIIDDSFLRYWNADQYHESTIPEMTAEWVDTKQAELDQDEIDLGREDQRLRAMSEEEGTGEETKEKKERGAGLTGLTELQLADLFITRLWLRTLVWQLTLSRGLLCSSPPSNTHQGLSLHFPARYVSAQLRSLVCRLESVASVGIHGTGILQKLFDITTTIADVLALPRENIYTREDARAQTEDVMFLVDFLFRFEGVPSGEREFMSEKLRALQGQMHSVMDVDVDVDGSAQRH